MLSNAGMDCPARVRGSDGPVPEPEPGLGFEPGCRAAQEPRPAPELELELEPEPLQLQMHVVPEEVAQLEAQYGAVELTRQAVGGGQSASEEEGAGEDMETVVTPDEDESVRRTHSAMDSETTRLVSPEELEQSKAAGTSLAALGWDLGAKLSLAADCRTACERTFRSGDQEIASGESDGLLCVVLVGLRKSLDGLVFSQSQYGRL